MLEKAFDINENGYSVRCRIMTAVNAREFDRVVICTHGFGGNKDAGNITKFAEKELAKYKNDAVIAFDWPCHGKDARKKLVLSECIDYLTMVINYARNTLKADHIYNYSVSFGAYITLKYIAELDDPFSKIALRCPAIPMYDLMKKNVDASDLEKLEKGKEVMVGFDRKMKVDKELFEDLKKSDVTKYEYFDHADRMLIIHGTKDSTVPIEASEKFAEDNVIEFIPVENADHPFKDPKLMDLAIHKMVIRQK